MFFCISKLNVVSLPAKLLNRVACKTDRLAKLHRQKKLAIRLAKQDVQTHGSRFEIEANVNPGLFIQLLTFNLLTFNLLTFNLLVRRSQWSLWSGIAVQIAKGRFAIRPNENICRSPQR